LAEKRVAVWYADHEYVTRLTDFPLDADALVFDVGGYKGDWALEVLCKHGCRIEVFEPVPEFHDQITRRFAFSDRVTTHPFGLGGATRSLEMGVSGERSSAFHTLARSAGSVQIEIRDVIGYLDQRAIEHVDLLKLNIEGAEYELLERVLDSGRSASFGFVLVQFHDELPDARDRAAAISERLDTTHELMWRVPFIWECWRLRR
jgi:FkbM family methyltransferase